MDDSLHLFINPRGFDLDHLSDDPEAITVTKTSGETVQIDPHQARLDISVEHPEVERMEGDWGAICEVFRKNNYYYAAIAGVSLAIGDRVTIRYKNEAEVVTLKVIDIENGRTRIDPPQINPSAGPRNP